MKTKLCVPTLALLLYSIVNVDGRKKKTASDGGGDDGGMFTCTESYVSAFHGGLEDSNYVGWDYAQAEDNVTMLDTDILLQYCAPIPYKSKEYGSTTTVTVNGDGSTTTTTVTKSPLDRRLLSEPVANALSKHGLGRRLLAGGDDGGETYYTTILPSLPSACDGDFEGGLSTCAQVTFEWECRILDPAGLTTKLREILKVEADDCWTTGAAKEFQCEGAPMGAQTCTYAQLPSDKYASGMTVTLEGDQCTACSLNADLCPSFYDVHSCVHTWETSDTLPKVNDTFKLTFVVNAAPSTLIPSVLLSVFSAMTVAMISRD